MKGKTIESLKISNERHILIHAIPRMDESSARAVLMSMNVKDLVKLQAYQKVKEMEERLSQLFSDNLLKDVEMTVKS